MRMQLPTYVQNMRKHILAVSTDASRVSTHAEDTKLPFTITKIFSQSLTERLQTEMPSNGLT